MLDYFVQLIMPSNNQKDEFTEVTRDREKRKASNSPTLPSQPKSGSFESPLGIPVRLRRNLSAVNRKFKNWRSIMGELRQYHPSLKVSQIKELPKGSYLIIGDLVQEIVILQSETKMKAALGKNVEVSPPTDITDKEFLEFLDLHIQRKIAGQNKKCLICGESHSHKGCPNKEARKPKCAICKGPHVASYKGCPEYKKQAFWQYVVTK